MRRSFKVSQNFPARIGEVLLVRNVYGDVIERWITVDEPSPKFPVWEVVVERMR